MINQNYWRYIFKELYSIIGRHLDINPNIKLVDIEVMEIDFTEKFPGLFGKLKISIIELGMIYAKIH